MNSDGNQQAYDRGVNIFSPDGRLYQVEYAREAVKRGSPSIGLRTADGIVLAAQTRVASPLRVSDSIEKIHKVDDTIGVATTGHVSDGRKLVDQFRVLARQDELRYGEMSTIGSLARDMSDHIQESTQVGGQRPFGASLLIGGVDEDGPHIYEVDPGGTPSEWDALAVGSRSGDAMEYLEAEYSEMETLSLGDGIALAVDALGEIADDLTVESVDVATISVEDEQLQPLTADELADYIDAPEDYE